MKLSQHLLVSLYEPINYFVIVTSFPIGLVKTKSQYGIPRCHLLQPQPAITCSELTLETLEQGVKYVQR